MKMAGLALLIVAAIVVVYLSTGHNAPVSDAPVHADIVLKEKGFSPDDVTIKKGGTITFSTDFARPFWPASNVHPSHTIYPEFDPRRPLQPGETWDFTFEKAGDWGFHDHLRSYYVGTIHVVE